MEPPTSETKWSPETQRPIEESADDEDWERIGRVLEAIDIVDVHLAEAEVDIVKCKIIWPDGAVLTVDDTVERIVLLSGHGEGAVRNSVLGWLEVRYSPKNLNPELFGEFEQKIEIWVSQFEK